MSKEKRSITVLKDFDGLNANVVETIKRKIIVNKKVPSVVSYKGKLYDIFSLSASYDIPYTTCISVK